MERSFWIPILIKHLNPETLQEKVKIIIHSLLLDLGFIPIRSVNNEDKEIKDTPNHTKISKFEIPITSQCKGISIELLPSNWRSDNEGYKLFYISKTSPKNVDKVTPELTAEFISSRESVLSLIRSSSVKETLELEFPFKTLERNNNYESLIFELSNSIKDKIDKFFNYNKIHTVNDNLEIDAEETHKISDIKYEPLIETSQRNIQDHAGSNIFKGVDPLIDDRGVRGSLVGPESTIFKSRQKVFGIPRNIPISSIPGGTTTPDNDMFFPPGNNNSDYTFNF